MKLGELDFTEFLVDETWRVFYGYGVVCRFLMVFFWGGVDPQKKKRKNKISLYINIWKLVVFWFGWNSFELMKIGGCTPSTLICNEISETHYPFLFRSYVWWMWRVFTLRNQRVVPIWLGNTHEKSSRVDRVFLYISCCFLKKTHWAWWCVWSSSSSAAASFFRFEGFGLVLSISICTSISIGII